MRKEAQPFHSAALAHHQARLFDTLLFKHQVVTETPKLFQFEDKDGAEFAEMVQGYLAVKKTESSNTKYFIPKDKYQNLPLRVNESEEMFFKDGARTKSAVLMPTKITPFRIVPEQRFPTDRAFFDALAPFSHSNPKHWNLLKVIAVMGYVGKTFLGICSSSEFGKSSLYEILDALTKKCPVFQPRSVPGVLAQITGDGNMIFDEVHETSAEVKACMENFSLMVAGNKPTYINGAQKSKNTRPTYNVAQQSITYLYNITTHYAEPEKTFWNYIWTNRKAMESRFLCLKFEGKLLEEFDTDFSIPDVADENRSRYIDFAKHLMYLQDIHIQNLYERRYVHPELLLLTGRHRIVYDTLTWGLDTFSESQEEYDCYVALLDKAIREYQFMLGGPHLGTYSPPIEQSSLKIETEEVVDAGWSQDAVLELIRRSGEMDIALLLNKTGINDSDVNRMIDAGLVFKPKPGLLKVL